MSDFELKKLSVETEDRAADITVFDSSYQVVSRASGSLSDMLPRGIYKIRSQLGSDVREKSIVLDEAPATVRFPASNFQSAAPLASTTLNNADHIQAAERESRDTHCRLGSGSELFVFVRGPEDSGDPSEGLTITAANGEMIKLSDNSARDHDSMSWSACNVATQPGLYRLSVTFPDSSVIEQAVVAVEGFQTQVFLLSSDFGDDCRRADLRVSTIFIRPPGFDHQDNVLRRSEFARLSLENGRQLMDKAAIRLLVSDLSANPLVGLYLLHLRQATLRLQSQSRQRMDSELSKPTCERLIHQLRDIFGLQNSDVEALALEFGETRVDFSTPPMLRPSWDLIVSNAASKPESVPPNSLSSFIAPRIGNEGIWLHWITPPEIDAATGPLQDLRVQVISELNSLRSRERVSIQDDGSAIDSAESEASVRLSRRAGITSREFLSTASTEPTLVELRSLSKAFQLPPSSVRRIITSDEGAARPFPSSFSEEERPLSESHYVTASAGMLARSTQAKPPLSTTKLNLKGLEVGVYRFLEKLGRGGFGEVWLAEERLPSARTTSEPIRKVAIKVYTYAAGAANEFDAFVARFSHDIRSLGRLSSWEIIQYYVAFSARLSVDKRGKVRVAPTRENVGSNEMLRDALFVVMEFADGGAVGPQYRDQMANRRQMPEFLRHFIGVASALKTAHGCGIVHCDVKPDNLLWFKAADLVKVGDFGIAQDLRWPRLGVIGTPYYMPPEAFANATHPSPARDVYALGCTVYEVLTGQKAFDIPPSHVDTRSMPERFLQVFEVIHANSPRPDAIQHVPELVSIEFSAFLKRMMAIASTDRPSLDEVIRTMESEREVVMTGRRPPQVRSEVPTGPVSRHICGQNINPRFRSEILKQHLYYLFVRSGLGQNAYRKILEILKECCGDAFSVAQVFGKHDLIVKVWSRNSSRIDQLCSRLVEQVLHGQYEFLTTLCCSPVTYLGSKKDRKSRPLRAIEALVGLREAQTDATGDKARSWLEKNGVLNRRPIVVKKENDIKCFCLVTVTREGERDFDGVNAMLTDVLSEHSKPIRLRSIAIGQRADEQLSGEMDNEAAAFVVEYIAPTFREVNTIPSVIRSHEPLRRYGLRTNTLLGTGALLIDSDLVDYDLEMKRDDGLATE